MFPGWNELLIILLIVLIIFGGKRIPELLGGLGKGIKSFKKGLNEPDIDQVSTEQESRQEIDEKNNKSV